MISTMTTGERSQYNEEDFTVVALEDLLVSAGIDITAWGKGEARTVAHLHKEICEGETILRITPEGKIVRSVRVAWVDVLFFDGLGNVYQLVEDRQEYRDGRTRRRQLDSSLGEKFKRGEAPDEAAMRALREELGVQSYKSLHSIGSKQTTYTPSGHPGLVTDYDMYHYVAVLDEANFNPDGYVEVQPDKTNYYTWELIRSANS